jgi:quercetin dioxygenase-like cupin family protein
LSRTAAQKIADRWRETGLGTNASKRRGVAMSDRIRRIVTGHDTAGLAVVLSDEQVSIVDFPGVSGWTAGSAVVWTTGSVPADNASDLVGSERPAGTTFNGGSVLRVIQFGPGFVSPIHRTLSIDYIAMLSGELELELDGGSVIRLCPGDIVVQRGTNHRWCNPSQDTPCRLVVSMIEAEPISIAGQTMERTL